MVVTRKIIDNLKRNEIRNYWINNLLNWTKLEVVVGMKRIQRKYDINSS